MSVILNMWGEDHALQFVKREYLNGNLAIEVLSEDEEYDGWESWCMLTTNLSGFELSENQAFLDTNNCSAEIITWIFENKYANVITYGQSGYCAYPLVEFSKAFMEMILITEEDLAEIEEE